MLAEAILLALTVLVDPSTRAVTVTAKEEPLGDVLSAVREKTGVKMIVDGAIERRLVSLDARYESGSAALKAIAEAAGASVEQSGEVYLVRKPKPAAPRPVGKVEDLGEGRFRALSSFEYPVLILRDRPEDRTIRAALAGFEHRQGFSLVVAPSIKETAIREYLEARDVYKRMLELAALPIDLTPDVDVRSSRIYVEPARQRYYAEILFTTGARGAEVAHLVYILDVQTLRCQALYIFKLPIGP